MLGWPAGEIRSLALDEMGEAYRRYRLSVPEAEADMAGSLRRYGQMSPLVVCLHEERAEVIDGFKRLTAARTIPSMQRLSARRESLSTDELRGVVDLLLASASREKEEYVLAKPREALRQARGIVPPAWDPRLSSAGNRISKQLGYLLDQLARMENWLQHRGRAELTACDRSPLVPGFSRLSREARDVAELADDFLLELNVS